MNRHFFIMAGAFAAIIAVALCFWRQMPAPIAGAYRHAALTLNGATFDARIAGTPALRERGLSGTEPLAASEAMLFVFDQPSEAGFWMKDMLYPIDIAWLDASMRIIHMEKRVAPETYPAVFYPGKLATYVIEAASGTLDRIGAKEGDEAAVAGGK